MLQDKNDFASVRFYTRLPDNEFHKLSVQNNSFPSLTQILSKGVSRIILFTICGSFCKRSYKYAAVTDAKFLRSDVCCVIRLFANIQDVLTSESDTEHQNYEKSSMNICPKGHVISLSVSLSFISLSTWRTFKMLMLNILKTIEIAKYAQKNVLF